MMWFVLTSRTKRWRKRKRKRKRRWERRPAVGVQEKNQMKRDENDGHEVDK